MLKIYDLFEGFNEDQVDNFIEERRSIPTKQLCCSYNLNTVVEDTHYSNSFYLAENDNCVWWFGPRNSSGVAGRSDYKWFCFRTEDGEYHKFDMSDLAHSREAMAKILQWIAAGCAKEEPKLEIVNEVEFMDI